jgi:hypothetical protein
VSQFFGSYQEVMGKAAFAASSTCSSVASPKRMLFVARAGGKITDLRHQRHVAAEGRASPISRRSVPPRVTRPRPIRTVVVRTLVDLPAPDGLTSAIACPRGQGHVVRLYLVGSVAEGYALDRDGTARGGRGSGRVVDVVFDFQQFADQTFGSARRAP